jgi:hypothetical protein
MLSSTRLAPTTASVVVVRSQTLTEFASPLELRFSRSTGLGNERSRRHPITASVASTATIGAASTARARRRIGLRSHHPSFRSSSWAASMKSSGRLQNGHRNGAGVDVEQSPTRDDDVAGLLTETGLGIRPGAPSNRPPPTKASGQPGHGHARDASGPPRHRPPVIPHEHHSWVVPSDRKAQHGVPPWWHRPTHPTTPLRSTAGADDSHAARATRLPAWMRQRRQTSPR